MIGPKSRILLVSFIVVMFFSVGVTYWRTMVEKSFVIIDDLEEEFTETGGEDFATE